MQLSLILLAAKWRGTLVKNGEKGTKGESQGWPE